jgi:hypothetical protein
VALAAAGLTKGFALLLLPSYARRCGKRLTLSIFIALLYFGLPLWIYLPKYLHGMQQYLDYVHVNSGLFGLVDLLLCFVSPFHFKIASILSDVAILASVAWSVWTPIRSHEEMLRRAIIVIAVCLLVVPSLFPWYVLWLLPLVAMYGERPSKAFICLAGCVDLVYIYYFDSAVHWWVPAVEYIPVFALLYSEIKRGYWRPAILGGAGEGSAGVGDRESPGAESSPEAVLPAAGTEATW